MGRVPSPLCPQDRLTACERSRTRGTDSVRSCWLTAGRGAGDGGRLVLTTQRQFLKLPRLGKHQLQYVTAENNLTLYPPLQLGTV